MEEKGKKTEKVELYFSDEDDLDIGTVLSIINTYGIEEVIDENGRTVFKSMVPQGLYDHIQLYRRGG